VWRFFPSVTYFSKYDSFFQVWPIFFCLAILLKRVSQKAAYHISCERRRISGCRLSPLENLSNFDRLKFCISSASRIFLCNGLQTIPKRVTTITVFLSRRLEPWWPRWIHEPAICIRQLKNINFCDVSLEKRKGITFDELGWFMKPFARHGESNLARIERRSISLTPWEVSILKHRIISFLFFFFFCRLNTLKVTAKALAVDLLRLNTLRSNKTVFLTGLKDTASVPVLPFLSWKYHNHMVQPLESQLFLSPRGWDFLERKNGCG